MSELKREVVRVGSFRFLMAYLFRGEAVLHDVVSDLEILLVFTLLEQHLTESLLVLSPPEICVLLLLGL